MNAKSRRKIEMGTRALNFSRAHPDASPGYAAALTSLEERLTRAEHLADQQRDGITDVRGATAKKRELRKTMRRTRLVHLARVARAAKEIPELAQKFALAPETTPYLAFRTAARGMVAEAQKHRWPPGSHRRERGARCRGGRGRPGREGDGRAQPLPLRR